MSQRVYLNPAHRVVRKLGEAIIQRAGDGISRRRITIWRCCRAVAQVIEVHPTQVFRWMRPKAVGGRGGSVPDHYQRSLLTYARTHRLCLDPVDFFDEGPDMNRQECSVPG